MQFRELIEGKKDGFLVEIVGRDINDFIEKFNKLPQKYTIITDAKKAKARKEQLKKNLSPMMKKDGYFVQLFIVKNNKIQE